MFGRKSVILEGILRLDHYFPECVITANHFSTKLLRSSIFRIFWLQL